MSAIALIWAANVRGLKPATKIVLIQLSERHNKDTGLCNPSIKTLAEDCEMDRTTVMRHIDILEGLGEKTDMEKLVDQIKVVGLELEKALDQGKNVDKLHSDLLKLKVAQYSGDTAGAYIISPISERVLQDWLGYKYAMTTQVPINLTKNNGTALTEVYFGNWAELIIGQWGGMEIMASQETSDAFEKDQTWIRILQEVDVGVRHDQSFCLISDAKAT